MKTSNVAGGAIAVAAIVGLKLLAKTAIFAAIFGGGVVANNAYQSRVDEVKREVVEANKKLPVNAQMVVDEQNKTIYQNAIIDDVHDNQLAYLNANMGEIIPLIQKDKQSTVADWSQKSDEFTNKFLIKQGWTFVENYKTHEGTVITSYRITKADFN